MIIKKQFLVPFILCCTIQSILKTSDANNIKEVLIKVGDAFFKRPLYNCQYDKITCIIDSDKDTSTCNDTHLTISVFKTKSLYYLATYQEFKELANLQHENHDAIIQNPIILFSSNTTSQSAGIGARFTYSPEPHEPVIIIMPLQLFSGYAKKHFIGHELRHLTRFC